MTNHNLIGLIYDAAIEPTLWPKLLDELAKELDSFEDVVNVMSTSRLVVNAVSSQASFSQPNQSQLAIQAHIARAFEISAKIRSPEDETRLETTLLNNISLPAFLVDEHLKVITQNTLATDFMTTCNDATVTQNKLCFANFSVRRQLQDCMANVVGNTQLEKQVIPFLSQKNNENNSILVLSIPNNTPRFLMMIATTQHLLNVDKQALEKVFGLSKAESKLADNLLAGLTLAEISTSQFISLNTLRTQLKSIFSKTNTKRQAELIRTLLTYPLITSDLIENTQAQLENAQAIHNPKHHQTFQLADGRTLGFAEYGDLSGEPILLFHPATGSRLQAHPDDSIATSLNARIIVPDRPGYGLSSPLKNRTLLSWPQDIAQLVKHLKLSKVSIVGFCGGSPYALACAKALPESVSAVTCVSGVTPYDNINLLHGVSPTNKLLVNLAVKMPDSIFHLISLMLKGLVAHPETYLDAIHHELCTTDQRALAEPQLTDNFIAALKQAFIQGPRAFTHEQLLLSKTWPFAVETIQAPVNLWHGNQDHHVDVTLAKKLANALPNATFHEIDDHGHFLVYHKWRDILSNHINTLP